MREGLREPLCYLVLINLIGWRSRKVHPSLSQLGPEQSSCCEVVELVWFGGLQLMWGMSAELPNRAQLCEDECGDLR